MPTLDMDCAHEFSIFSIDFIPKTALIPTIQVLFDATSTVGRRATWNTEHQLSGSFAAARSLKHERLIQMVDVLVTVAMANKADSRNKGSVTDGPDGSTPKPVHVVEILQQLWFWNIPQVVVMCFTSPF